MSFPTYQFMNTSTKFRLFHQVRASTSAITRVVILWLSLAGHAAGAEPRTPVEVHGQLRVAGNRIVNQYGEPVQLRGMSLFWSQWMPKYYSADAVRWLRDDWNCNLVRVAMAVGSGGYLTNPDEEWRKVRRVIDTAIELGIYVIIDWHDHHADRNVEAAKKFFGEIAREYGHRPHLIYEPWNEPLNTHDWGKVIKPYHEAVIPVIRAHDPDNLIILGTQTWSQDVDKAAADPVAGDNLAYTLHFYAATHKQRLRDKARKALEAGVALMVTEWGTSEATGGGKLDYEETAAWLEFMDRHQLSWCNWSVADKRETSAALRPGAAGVGGWTDEVISPSGLLVRQQLRAKNPPASLKLPVKSSP